MEKEEELFISRFCSGRATTKGNFSFAPFIWWSGIIVRPHLSRGGLLTLCLTRKEIRITSLTIPIWKAALDEIISIKIKSLFTGGCINIESRNNQTGFMVILEEIGPFVEKMKELNLPLEYDQTSLQKEARRRALLSNPTVLVVGVILGAAFIIFLIYNILLPIFNK